MTKIINRRSAGNNVWLGFSDSVRPAPGDIGKYDYQVLDTEGAVGQKMFDELVEYAENKPGDLVIVLLGGRGAQVLHRILGEKAQTGEIDALLARLNVFTQDALAPMRMENALSFVRDFERLLGTEFFGKIKSFTSMNTDTGDLEGELIAYIERIEELGGIDILFLGLGPEAAAASHLCYIKPGSGARWNDFAGIIPISSSILEHHITKFKAGGSDISSADEAQCRAATHILTLGPAAILSAKMIVQSIVDASTAPGKRDSFRRLTGTAISTEESELDNQLDENPGLWIRLHPCVKSYVLPDLIG